jgi:Tol biopolymer transport system component
MLSGYFVKTKGVYESYKSNLGYYGVRPQYNLSANSIVFSTPSTGHGDIVERSAINDNFVKITASDNYEGEPAICEKTKTLAFVREDAQHLGMIILLQLDSKLERQLSPIGRDFRAPAFSPDGTHIACTEQNGRIWSSELRLIDVRTGVIHEIDTGPGANMCPSMDRSGNIWFQKIDKTGSWICTISPGTPLKVVIEGSAPAVSTSGSIVAFVAGQESHSLEVLNIVANKRTAIYKSKALLLSPALSPDNSFIVFVEDVKGDGTGDIAQVDIDGSNYKKLFAINDLVGAKIEVQ